MDLQLIYILLVGVGTLYLAAAFILGEIFDFVGHLADGITHAGDSILEGIGNFVEGFFNNLESDPTHLDAPDFSPGTGMDHEIGETRPSIFSFRVLVTFLTGIGAGGLIGYGMGLPEVLTLIPALGFGVLGAVMMFYVLKALYSGQVKGTSSTGDYVGVIGVVSTSIPEDGSGGVDVTVRLVKKTLPAVSKSGRPIPLGTEVYVDSIQEGGIAVVNEVD